ncbi:MAG: archaemetzincin family Zn-dependent metalloprotease [Methanomicrobiales archaeon]|nr:archaemetzincin family Zn-dependent metalloprotease [Methanomicrobiales archaeon]
MMGIKMLWDTTAAPGLALPVARTVAAMVDMPVFVEENRLLLNGYDNDRKQYDARAILDRLFLQKRRLKTDDPLLLVVQHDLFDQGSDFVFGLARASAGTAVVSALRLDNRYYGRVESDPDLVERIAKESAHEIGHLEGLDHCADPECIMFPPRTLDELDRKRKVFCHPCRERLAGLRRRRIRAP